MDGGVAVRFGAFEARTLCTVLLICDPLNPRMGVEYSSCFSSERIEPL
jgi:hypothetical protein